MSLKVALEEINQLGKKGGILTCQPVGQNHIRIEEFYADKPGNGWGLNALRKVPEILDRHQCKADCFLDQDSPTGMARLRKLYHHFGFRDSGFLKMTRQPRTI